MLQPNTDVGQLINQYQATVAALQRLCALPPSVSNEDGDAALATYEQERDALAALLPRRSDGTIKLEALHQEEALNALLAGIVSEDMLKELPTQLSEQDEKQTMLEMLLYFSASPTAERALWVADDEEMARLVVGIDLVRGGQVPMLAPDCFSHPYLNVGASAAAVLAAIFNAMHAARRVNEGQPPWPDQDEDEEYSPLADAVGRALEMARSLDTRTLNDLLLDPYGSLAAWIAQQFMLAADLNVHQALYESRQVMRVFFTELGWPVDGPSFSPDALASHTDTIMIATSPTAAARAIVRAYRAAESLGHWHDPWDIVDHSGPYPMPAWQSPTPHMH